MGIPFNESELTVVDVQPAGPHIPEIKIFDYPISNREAVRNSLRRRPTWVPIRTETQTFIPTCVPDNTCRAIIREIEPFDNDTQAGGRDMFGVKWVYVPVVGGSMEDPAEPHLLEDVNDWRERIVFPDVDSWDWEGCAQRNEAWIDHEKFVQTWLFTGWFERLVSFMGFENAAMALLDEDQTEAIKDLMFALTDTYNDIMDHFKRYFDVDCAYVHDDWGSQASAFFNADVCAELIVPAMRKFTDHCHEIGMFAELHSCGRHGAVQMGNVAAAGWDSWCPQDLNDCDALWQEYGDQVMLAPIIDRFEADAPVEVQVEAAKRYVEKYCTTPGKPVYLNFDDESYLTPAFREALYRYSREAYAAWPE